MFRIQTEENHICRLEFLIPQPALIHSLAKILRGAMIYDDDRIIRFKAARIERYSGKLTSYEESLRFIWCIATQIKCLITEHRHCFYTFVPSNLWRIDDTFVYINDVMEMDDQGNIQITHFIPFLFENAHSEAFSSAKSNCSMRIENVQKCINTHNMFLSPELMEMDKVPFYIHYKTIYYSFGKLLQTISDYPLDISDCILEEPEKRAIRFP